MLDLLDFFSVSFVWSFSALFWKIIFIFHIFHSFYLYYQFKSFFFVLFYGYKSFWILLNILGSLSFFLLKFSIPWIVCFSRSCFPFVHFELSLASCWFLYVWWSSVASYLCTGALCGARKNANIRFQTTIRLLLCQNDKGFPLRHHHLPKMPSFSPCTFFQCL